MLHHRRLRLDCRAAIHPVRLGSNQRAMFLNSNHSGQRRLVIPIGPSDSLQRGRYCRTHRYRRRILLESAHYQHRVLSTALMYR